MGRRSPNPRRIKIHRNYTVEEVARVLGVHKNTVRTWIKLGLDALMDRKPVLILGRVLRPFLEARRARAKQTCPPGYFYCVRCQAPKPPALQMAEYIAFTATTGNLRGICPDCGSLDPPPRRRNQDCLGILPTNALTAATEILIPVTSDPKAFRALKQLLETVAGFRRKLNPHLHLSGIVVTNHDGRTQLGRQMLELLREEYPRDVLPVVIPRSVRTQESSALGKSILTYQPASPVSQAYRELALEITKHAHAA